ncbi:MAG: transposase [Candidatus Levybacteria bacterium]|nr:transposase [Candidatus Levybacteria bacterium]
MPRGPRLAFQNALYHVFNRGINKQNIFLSDEDYKFFLGKLRRLRQKYDFSIYALCLMPNHFHVSIQTRKIPISKIMSSLTTSYSMYFNRKYNHFGPVFQNRFKSILIENDSYFLGLSRYIYLNPVKAGFVKDPAKYKYTSLREVLGKEPYHFIDQDIIRLIGESEKSRKNYEKFIYEGINENLEDFKRLFQTEEATLGSNRFSTMAKKKYLRRKSKTISNLG